MITVLFATAHFVPDFKRLFFQELILSIRSVGFSSAFFLVSCLKVFFNFDNNKEEGGTTKIKLIIAIIADSQEKLSDITPLAADLHKRRIRLQEVTIAPKRQ